MQLLVQPVEERQPKHEQRDDVLTLHRSDAGQERAAMLRGVKVETRGVAVEKAAGLVRKISLIAIANGVPDAQQLDHVVVLGRADAVNVGQASARGKQRALKSLKIILGMGIGEAESHVGIPAA